MDLRIKKLNCHVLKTKVPAANRLAILSTFLIPPPVTLSGTTDQRLQQIEINRSKGYRSMRGRKRGGEGMGGGRTNRKRRMHGTKLHARSRCWCLKASSTHGNWELYWSSATTKLFVLRARALYHLTSPTFTFVTDDRAITVPPDTFHRRFIAIAGYCVARVAPCVVDKWIRDTF